MHKVIQNKKLNSVATLGTSTELTCSEYVAKRAMDVKEIVSCPSFEIATDYVKSGQADIALVPCAYPEIRKIIMDPELIVQNTFIHEIPPLVLAGKLHDIPSSTSAIYHHPATLRLLDEVCIPFKQTVPVTSNAESCKRVVNGDQDSLAITNTLCANFFKLTIYKVIRKSLKMPWVCFKKLTN